MTDKSTIADMAEAEQTEFVELVTNLTATEWAAPSLCDGLSVRDIVVHIAADIHGEPNGGGDQTRRSPVSVAAGPDRQMARPGPAGETRRAVVGELGGVA